MPLAPAKVIVTFWEEHKALLLNVALTVGVVFTVILIFKSELVLLTQPLLLAPIIVYVVFDVGESTKFVLLVAPVFVKV